MDAKAPPSRNKGGALAPPSTKKRVEACEEEYILSTGNLIRQTNLVTSDNIPEIEKMEEVMGPTLEKWPALLPIAPLPKKTEEYEFKVFGDES